MPKAGLNTERVVVAGAELADEAGIAGVSLAALAARLGVKPPTLYKHVASLQDLRYRIAILAMTEVGDQLRDALQGRSGSDALAAAFTAMRHYIVAHPGRYAATTGARFAGPDDPLFIASNRVVNSIRAVLAGYGIPGDRLDHTVRALRCSVHGFALLQVSDGFQWGNDQDESFDWMIRLTDLGLRSISGRPGPAGRQD
ncbi:MAG TPA: WHG domain-containing protein [Trebonia sp.]|jgi:AcrR family transcriptional regulator|nr:WHG domain-containing protein [Trebonia sp.]